MTVSTNNYQIGSSATANLNFHLTPPAIPDGTLSLYRGNVGAPIGPALLTVSADGSISYPSDTAWTSVAGTVASSGGALGASPAVTFRYKRIGKSVLFSAIVSVPNNGTGSGTLVIGGLPVVSAGVIHVASGFNVSTASTVAAQVPASSAQVNLTKYDGTYPIASGQFISVTGFYESV